MTTPSDNRADETAPSVDGGRAEDRGGLGRQVRHGAMWSAANTIAGRLVGIAVMAAVARLVTPDELGVFALAIAVHGFILSLAELGVASILARADVDPDSVAPTVALIACVCSTALALSMAIFAPEIATALGNPAAAGPLRILAIGVFLVGPSAVPGALLQREFRQDLVFKIQMIGFIPGSAVLLIGAALGDGAQAFAWSRVTGQLIACVAMIIVTKKIWRPSLSRKVLRMLLAFGLPLAGANLLSQVLLNIDYVMLGRSMTATDVGLYMLAFGVAGWPIAIVGSALASVVLPAFSTVRKNGGDLEEALSRAVGLVAMIALPISAAVFALAPQIIAVLYGGRWSAAVAPLRALAVYGAVFALCQLFANVVVAFGRTGALLRVQAVALVILVPSLYVGIKVGGLVGVGVAHALVIVVVTLPAYFRVIRHVIGASMLSILKSLYKPAMAAVLAGGAAFLTAQISHQLMVQSVSAGLVGLAVYFALMWRTIGPMLPARVSRGSAKTEPLKEKEEVR